MIEQMTSGECRAIGRPDLHVYCHNPMTAFTREDGRQAWRRDEDAARYCVVCPDEGFEYLPYDQWVASADAWRIVDRILAQKRKAG